MITPEEILAIAEKLRAAQKRAVEPAAYANSHDAATANIYANCLDEALEQWNQQQSGGTIGLRDQTSIEEVPE